MMFTRGGRASLTTLRSGMVPQGSRGMAKLAHEIIRSDKAPEDSSEPRKTAIVMHGILGNHKNLRQLSTRLANAFPDYDMLLLTHRAHGNSERGEPPHTVHACSDDVFGLLEEKNIKAIEMVIGHSFGGKVSLGLLERFAQGKAPAGMKPPRQTWILDSPPGRWVPGHEVDSNSLSQSVTGVLEALKHLPQPLKSKSHLVEEMTKLGFSMELAQWMTLNVQRVAQGEYCWSFDLDIIQQLFQSHTETDFWPLLEGDWLASHPECTVSFLQAERNGAWTESLVRRFDEHPHPEQVQRILIPNAGHWLHVENPKEVFEAMAPSFHPNA